MNIPLPSNPYPASPAVNLNKIILHVSLRSHLPYNHPKSPFATERKTRHLNYQNEFCMDQAISQYSYIVESTI